MTAKVFVGNLVFSTTDEELKNAFAPSANVYVLIYPKLLMIYRESLLERRKRRKTVKVTRFVSYC